MLVVRKSIEEIAGAVAAVRHAFEIGALVAILLTVLLAIPLAGTLVSRLQRLRQAALQLAIGGTVGSFPADRARDEVGDLARSFSIMQRRLRQQEEARRAFVATASHELRTPLASLEGMLELLADDLQAEQPDLDDAAALLDRARVQSRRLARLAADLLDLSRIDAEVSLRSEPIELGELGRAVLAEFELPSAEPRRDRLADRRRQADLGAGRSRQRRPDPADPARQRPARGARGQRDPRARALRPRTDAERQRRGAGRRARRNGR